MKMQLLIEKRKTVATLLDLISGHKDNGYRMFAPVVNAWLMAGVPSHGSHTVAMKNGDVAGGLIYPR